MFHRFTPESLSMKGVLERIALSFKVGWQWLIAPPHYRGALLCGLSVVGAMIAIGYNGSKGIFGSSVPVTQTNDVVAARISAMADGLGVSKPHNTLPKNGIGQTEVLPPSAGDDDFSNGKEGPSARAIALDKSFLVADTEKPKAAIRNKEEDNKTVKKSPNKPQRRVSSERDRKFNPSQELKRAGDKITRVIRDIF